MKHIFRYIIGIIILSVVAYTIFLIWQQSRPVSDQYYIHESLQNNVRCEVTISGEIAPQTEILLYPQISGIVERILVKEGDEVKKGDVIAIIAKNQQPIEITSAHSEVNDAQIVVDQQNRETARARELYDNGIITRQELEQQEHLLRRAEATLSHAKDASLVAQRGYAPGNSNVTEVRCPINGRVLALPVQEQMTVVGPSPTSMGTVIAKVGNSDEMIFRGMVDESQAAQIELGQQVTLKVAALPNQPINAIVNHIASEAQKVNGIKQYEVKATLKNDGGHNTKLRSGYSAYAYITTAEVKNVVTAPEAVITEEDGNYFVYELVSQDKDGQHQEFQRIPVTVGLSNGLIVELTSGVKPGMQLRGTKINK